MNGQNAKADPGSGAGYEPPQGSKPGRLERLAWLPIPLLAAAIIAGRMAGLREPYPSPALTLVLSFTFYTLVSLGTLFLIGRSFLASGRPGLLLLECGVLLWSLAGTVGDAVSRGDANVNVTIFNTGIFLAGLCHLAGAILTLRPQRTLRPASLWLGAGFALTLGALGLVTWAALANWLPVFFIPGRGGTLVRYCVLVSAIAMFLLSAGLLLAPRREARPLFTFWYALALLLLAVGLFGVMIQLSLGSAVNWLGRAAQWLGGAYLLLAASASMRESRLSLLPPENRSLPARYRYGVAVAMVIAAAAVRSSLSPALETSAPFLTFYPAVILAALYGGLRAGLLATVISAFTVPFFWTESLGQLKIGSPAFWVPLLLFFLVCAMISLLVEATHRARARAAAAETKALIAAEREAAAEILQKSEERYHTLFTGMTEGFAIHELLTDESGKPVDYRFLDVNPAFERLTGLKRGDVVGKTQKEVLPGEDPKWLQMYGPVALTGQPVHFENYAPVLKRHYEVFAYRPAPRQFAVILMDITGHKRSEEALRESRAKLEAALESMTEAVFIADTEGRFSDVNGAFARYHRFRDKEDCCRRIADCPKYLDIFFEDGKPAPLNMWAMSRALRGETTSDAVYMLRRKDTGETWWGSYNFGPIRDKDGGIVGAVVAVREITERRRAEEALRKAKDELETRVAERTEELAKSHERLQHLASQLILAQEKERKRVAVEVHDGLLSELAAMKMLLEVKIKLLEQGNLSDLGEFKRVADILGRVMKEARGIMNNLHPSVLDELGLIAAVSWLAGEYEKSYPHIKVLRRLEVSEQDISLSLRIVIFRVLQEALNNFARHGKGNLLDLSLIKSGHSFDLAIRDNGKGFDVEKVQKGVGLESMRERVELSGGQFQVESVIGQGTTIRAMWNNS